MSADSRAEFLAALNLKLDAGAREYGDRSFDRRAPDLLSELEAEALDLAGWGFVLWTRLRRLRARAERVDGASRTNQTKEEQR